MMSHLRGRSSSESPPFVSTLLRHLVPISQHRILELEGTSWSPANYTRTPQLRAIPVRLTRPATRRDLPTPLAGDEVVRPTTRSSRNMPRLERSWAEHARFGLRQVQPHTRPAYTISSYHESRYSRAIVPCSRPLLRHRDSGDSTSTSTCASPSANCVKQTLP